MDYLRPQYENKEIQQLSVLSLAYIGDAVYELMVRNYMCSLGYSTSNHLHTMTVKKVNATAQAKDMDLLFDVLSDEELAIYKRGRNSTPKTVPSSCTRAEYAKATGFEALFGYLFLKGQEERLNELFDIVTG